MKHRVLAVGLFLALLSACGSPTEPVPQPSPVSQEQVNLSGVVTDEDGGPVAGASVRVGTNLDEVSRYTTSTDANGRYQFDLPLVLPELRFIRAHAPSAENVQALQWPAGGYTAVKNVRLRRLHTIVAGESMVLVMDTDSSLCVWEFATSADDLCAYFYVRVTGPTRFTIAAHSLDGGPDPLVGWEHRGATNRFTEASPDSVTSLFSINLSIRNVIAGPRRYEVITSTEGL